MKENEKGTVDVAGQTAPVGDTGNNTKDSITQNANNGQDSGSGDGKKKKSKKKWSNSCHVLAPQSKTYSIAIKCYAEQLVYGWDYVKNVITGKFRNQGNEFLTDMQIAAIMHDRDIVFDPDSIWLSASEKPHFHIIARCKDKRTRYRVTMILDALGIKFRDQDRDLWANRGVETVGSFAAYATYLTHETEDAIRDGKELYHINEVVTNLTTDEYLRVREGYIRVADAYHKITPKDLVEMDEVAYKLGYELDDFNLWYNSLPFNVRSHAKMRTIRESYDRGVDAKIAEHTEITRLSVYIKGDPDTGKTYASEHGLPGKRIYHVKSNDTGKFDNLRPSHDAIILDDTTCGNIINLTDNYLCRVYRRNKNNPIWAGEYFIVTSNLSFDNWLEKSGVKIYTKDYVRRDYGSNSWYYDECNVLNDTYKAIRSRFYLCEIVNDNGVNRLKCNDVSRRGSYDEQLKRCEMFVKFKEEFNRIMSAYTPKVQQMVDYTKVLD